MQRGPKVLLLAALALPLAGAAAVALGVGRGDRATCEVEERPEQASVHLPSLPPGFEYNSFPPTSGPSAEQPLVWEAYDEPVSQFELVHNLLHGGVAVQYGSGVREEERARIQAWYEADPDGIVLAPLPALRDSIALTAWRRLARCSAFDEAAFSSFRSSFRFNGPERLAPEELRRGQGAANPLGLRVTPSPVRDRATITLSLDAAATIELEIRRGGADGPVVRRFPSLALLPGRGVELTWDVRDDQDRPLQPGRYAAVARAGDGGPSLATALFAVR